MKTCKLTVIGIGQTMRGDDAAGLIAVQTWKDTSVSLLNHPEINVLLTELPGLSLLDSLGETENAILVDGVQSGAVPGSLHLLQDKDIQSYEIDARSAHGWGVAETLKLGFQLDPLILPARLILIGIECENFEVGAALSQAVRSSIPGAVTLIEHQVRELLQF